MNIFSEIRSSVHDRSYYKNVLEDRPLSSSIKYFLLFALIASLAASILFSALVSPGLTDTLRKQGASIIDGFPETLVISIKDGKASSSSPEPYTVPYFLSPEEQEEGLALDHFLVVDTARQFDIETFKDYRSLIVLNETTFAAYDNGKVSVTPLDKAPNVTFDKKDLISAYGRIEPYFPAVPVIVSLLFFGFAFSFTGWKLVYLFFIVLLFMKGSRWYVPYIALGGISLAALAVSANVLAALAAVVLLAALVVILRKHMGTADLSYWKAYQFGIHTATLPILIDGTLGVLGLYPPIPLFFTILMVGSAIMNIRSHDALQGTSA